MSKICKSCNLPIDQNHPAFGFSFGKDGEWHYHKPDDCIKLLCEERQRLKLKLIEAKNLLLGVPYPELYPSPAWFEERSSFVVGDFFNQLVAKPAVQTPHCPRCLSSNIYLSSASAYECGSCHKNFPRTLAPRHFGVEP